nr:strictosidine synthase 5 [Dendrobium officinale]
MADSNNSTASRLINLKLALPFLLLTSLPVLLSLILTSWHSDFDPSPLPVSYGFRSKAAAAAEEHNSVLGVSERVGEGLRGPEDLAYDEKEGVLYTGCYDGWIRKVRVAAPARDEEVEDWVEVGGRPLGLALASDGSLVVAEAYRGLLKVNKDGEVNVLTDEAEGKKFKLTDGVDVSSKGIIYFTDASYKYSLDMHLLDSLEGRPYGRLLSFDPSSNQTTVLLRDLYFANGVSLSPDQQSLIFCETPLWRCRRYHIEGEKKGRVEEFIENLPGFPDNIRYDGDGHYLIGLPVGRTLFWDLLMKYPLLRKLKVALGMHVNFPSFKNSGLMRVNLEGKPVALYKDPELSLITGGFKIGKHLYLGSLFQNYLLRIDITKLLATKP